MAVSYKIKRRDNLDPLRCVCDLFAVLAVIHSCRLRHSFKKSRDEQERPRRNAKRNAAVIF